MRKVQSVPVSALTALPPIDRTKSGALLSAELTAFNRKIVVLDDDPTGIQTVHGVSVFTGWGQEDIDAVFAESAPLSFILTNSRSFSQEQTRAVHKEIAARIVQASARSGRDYLLVSRGDSTMRGHYPAETQTLCETIEALSPKRFCGEIIVPCFPEGGRYTMNNIHYVREGKQLVPIGDTEFARDKTFGYASSDLCEWCEEKTGGAYPADKVLPIPLEDLRNFRIGEITERLCCAQGFNKIVVNAVDYGDLEVFSVALLRAVAAGREYLLRSAAAIVRVLGGILERPLLGRSELVTGDAHRGGLILAGSHVGRTTAQLEQLRGSSVPVSFLEFDQHRALESGGLEAEAARVTELAASEIRAGRTAAVCTRRERLDLKDGSPEAQLALSVRISQALTSVVGNLPEQPAFIIAKGGITSSDVGVQALRVKKATVMGQVKPGVPVWMTGSESKFPQMPFIIFPGNVGDADTLREVVELLSAPR